jgi:hypothetical protein
LDGFNSVYITPGLFREMLKRTFNVILTGKELGAMTKYFDRDGVGDICCQAFLVHFTKVGAAERGKDHIQGLQKQWAENEERKRKERDKLEAAAKKNLLDQSRINEFSESDLDSATTKFHEAARHYSVNICDMPGSLDAFSVASMLPGVFQEKCIRILHVTLTNAELGAVVAKFDLRGDKSEVDCSAFTRFFKKIGFEEKEKLWKAEKRMRDKQDEERKARMAKVKEDFSKAVEAGAVDPNFTEADLASGMQKLRFAASHVEAAASSGSIVVNAFAGTCISAGQLREKLKSAIGVRMTPRELGAVTKPHTLPDGSISCADFVSLIMSLSKDVREELRLKRIAAERADREKLVRQKDNLILQKHQIETEVLQHDHTHESSLLVSLNSAAQAFALDKSVLRLFTLTIN